MKLLLDTHVLLWWLANSPELSPATRDLIRTPAHSVAVSVASAWEISIKQGLGKLVAPDDLVDQLESGGVDTLPISVADALAAGQLPRHHDDPFDRMLIAQAQIRGLTVVTRDSRFESYSVDIVRA